MKFGWKKDTLDKRDLKYKQVRPLKSLFILPCKADIRTMYGTSPIFDQGELGSCTANATSSAIWYVRKKQFNFGGEAASRLFLYYNSRKEENTIFSDEGAMMRTSIKCAAKYGVVPELLWRYHAEKFTNEPPQNLYEVAEKNQVLKYYRLSNNLRELKSCIASGYPFVFGFQVFESFMTREVETTGYMKLPMEGEQDYGGHAVLGVGYNDKNKYFVVQNSWGTRWGDKGFFYMPYEYITNAAFADDFWTIRIMEA